MTFLGGIIFDMDNTLLSSKINFKKMKQRVVDGLQKRGSQPDLRLSTSQLLAWAEEQFPTDKDFTQSLWQAVAEEENLGLSLAEKEPGAEALLNALKGEYYLALLTNNQEQAARETVAKMGVLPHVHQMVGRESVPALKPSPLGYLAIMKQQEQIKKWVAIGDAWNDGEAARLSGIPFIAYVGSRKEHWPQREVKPVMVLEQWGEKEIEAIRNFFAHGF